MLKKIKNISVFVLLVLVYPFSIAVGACEKPSDTIQALGRTLTIHARDKLPMLIVGPATLFFKNYLPISFDHYFELHFVDIFEKTSVSDSIDDLTLDSFVEGIENIRKGLGLDKMVLFGHSSNGILALKYSYKYPQHVLCNILVGTTPFRGDEKIEISNNFLDKYALRTRKLLYKDDQDTLSKIHHPTFFDKYNVKRALNFYDPEDKRGENLWQGTNLDEELINKYFSLIDTFNIKQEKEKFTIPTFLALGEHDYNCPYVLWDLRDNKSKEEKYRKDNFIMLSDPLLTSYVFKKSAHFAMIEEEDEFMHQLLFFLKERNLFFKD